MPIIRKICQLSVLTLFCALPFLASLGFSALSGTFFSLNFFGVPFADPASTLQVLGQSALENFLPLSTILLGTALSLILAFFMGRIFCGWLCPYGFFSELLSGRKKAWKNANRVKVLIFLSVLVLACLFSYPLITILSMPGQITLSPLIWQTDWKAALLLLLPPFLALILDLILRRRFFCSYICPQSVLLGAAAALLPKTVPGLRIKWQKERCTCKGAPCEKACQFALSPRKKLKRNNCVMCGDCIAACAKQGSALHFSAKNSD